MSKADQIRDFLKDGPRKSQEIARIVGCHPGYVRAVKQRTLHPDRENERFRVYYRDNVSDRRTKQLARNRRYYQAIAADPVRMELRRQARRQREAPHA